MEPFGSTRLNKKQPDTLGGLLKLARFIIIIIITTVFDVFVIQTGWPLSERIAYALSTRVAGKYYRMMRTRTIRSALRLYNYHTGTVIKKYAYTFRVSRI